jgi:AraC family transcriptional regulator of arabinose operon
LVKSLIQERYQEELALVDLAAKAHVSPGHLIRLFRKHEAMTPTQYLWRYRVERGVELLRTTGLAIGEVAERCGFKTSYHFARMVKAYKGRPPKEIRCNDWNGRAVDNGSLP